MRTALLLFGTAPADRLTIRYATIDITVPTPGIAMAASVTKVEKAGIHGNFRRMRGRTCTPFARARALSPGTPAKLQLTGPTGAKSYTRCA